MDVKQSIDSFTLVILDLETTGLDVVTGDAICEIGMVKLAGLETVDTFQTLINPQRAIPAAASAVHGIYDAEVKSAPVFSAVAQQAVAFMQGCVVGTYNAGFDIGFFNYQLRASGLPPLDNPIVDVLLMARRLLPQLPKYTLGAITQHLRISCPDTLHRALADAAAAAQVYHALRAIARQKNLHMLGDFVMMFGYSDDTARTKEMSKALMIKEAIARKLSVKIRYFSAANAMEEEKVKPLHVLEEKKKFFLWCQASDGQKQVALNSILQLQITP